MLEFKMHTHLSFIDTLADFATSENLGPQDFILTNQFLYEKYLAPLHLSCPYGYLETYGRGEPTTDMVDALRQDLPSSIHRMIAVGGGAVMDVAKMLSLGTIAGKTEDLFNPEYQNAPITPLFDVYAVPTTCGTGSEVTNAFAVELVSLHTKKGLNTDLAFARKSILIPELLIDLPYQFFATSSIDALIHAVESFLSPKASPISELFSKEAITMIIDGYLYVAKDPSHKWTDLASQFQIASTYAGLAFCSAGCAGVHALSYPLGGGYHISHGEANQLVFAATMVTYQKKKPIGKLNQLEELLTQRLNVPVHQALETAFHLFDTIQPRKPLREYGIAQSELFGFAQGVFAGQTRLLNNNYVPFSVEDMVSIYQSIY